MLRYMVLGTMRMMKVKKIMTRLETYCTLLEDIYGKRIVEAFTTKNENSLTLTMNNEANNQKAKKEYDRKDGEGCKICQTDFEKIKENKFNFFKRNLEFPGWIGDLDFSGTTPAKEIMIIGEAPTTLKAQVDQINIVFGLGLYPIESNGKLNFDQLKKTYFGEETRLKKIINNQNDKNQLWEYLNRLFSEKLDVLKPKIYITDLCKCDAEKNECIWEACRDKYLIKEIELINPNLIIFQGGDSYASVKRYLKSKLIKYTFIKKYRKIYPKLGFGKFPFNGKDIYFFKINHQAYWLGRYASISDRTDYINQYKKFIKEKILVEVLNII